MFSLNQSGEYIRMSKHTRLFEVFFQAGQPAVWTDMCSQCVTMLTTLTTKLGGPDCSKPDPVPASLPAQLTTTSGTQYLHGYDLML